MNDFSTKGSHSIIYFPFPPQNPLHPNQKKTEQPTHLQNLQLFQPFLHQLLHLCLVRLRPVLPKRISRPPFGVFAKIVSGELGGLAEERAELAGRIIR